MNQRTKRERGKRISRPDAVEKILESCPDIFADIINVLIYHGKSVVNPANLTDYPSAAMYKAAEGYINQKDRDLAMWGDAPFSVRVIYGLENQTKVSQVAPVRVMGYDYASYERTVRQLKAKNKLENNEADYALELHPGQLLHPVITLVLYFGLKPWDGPRSLHELIEVPDELKQFVPNYTLNLTEIAFLPPETINQFTSDFKIIAQWFRAQRLGSTRELLKSPKPWVHVEELLEFFSVFAGNLYFQEFKSHLITQATKGESVNMRSLFDMIFEEAHEKGLAEGHAEGLAEGHAEGLAEGRAEGHAEGRAEGHAEGRAEGHAEARYEIFNQLITEGNFTKEQSIAILNFTPEELEGFQAWRARSCSSHSQN